MCWLPPRNSLSLPVGSSCEWPLGVQGHRDPPCSLQTFIEWLFWLDQMQGANNWPMEQLSPSLVKWFNEFTKVTYKKYGCLLGICITKKSHIPKGWWLTEAAPQELPIQSAGSSKKSSPQQLLSACITAGRGLESLGTIEFSEPSQFPQLPEEQESLHTPRRKVSI